MTHVDKLINAIVTCINTIRNPGNGKNESNISNLNQLWEATNQIVERNGDKATEEATEPSSTNPTETVERNGDKATEEATDSSSANPSKPSLDTNPFSAGNTVHATHSESARSSEGRHSSTNNRGDAAISKGGRQQ